MAEGGLRDGIFRRTEVTGSLKMATCGRDEQRPFVVGRKGEWTATDKTGVNADKANTAEQVDHARTR